MAQGKAISEEQQVQIIAGLLAGEKNADIARRLGVAHTSVTRVKKMLPNLCELVQKKNFDFAELVQTELSKYHETINAILSEITKSERLKGLKTEEILTVFSQITAHRNAFLERLTPEEEG